MGNEPPKRKCFCQKNHEFDHLEYESTFGSSSYNMFTTCKAVSELDPIDTLMVEDEAKDLLERWNFTTDEEPECDLKKLVELMELLGKQTKDGHMDYELILAVYREWLLFMVHCGSYIGLAFREMTAQLQTMTKNKKLLKDKLKIVQVQKTRYITDFCLEEVKLGLNKFSLRDNERHFLNACKKPRSKITRKMKDDLINYNSTVRTF